MTFEFFLKLGILLFLATSIAGGPEDSSSSSSEESGKKEEGAPHVHGQNHQQQSPPPPPQQNWSPPQQATPPPPPPPPVQKNPGVLSFGPLGAFTFGETKSSSQQSSFSQGHARNETSETKWTSHQPQAQQSKPNAAPFALPGPLAGLLGF